MTRDSGVLEEETKQRKLILNHTTHKTCLKGALPDRPKKWFCFLNFNTTPEFHEHLRFLFYVCFSMPTVIIDGGTIVMGMIYGQ